MNIVAISTVKGRQQTWKFELSESKVLKIGRGWSNDIIIDDEYADPEHARISLGPNGSCLISDMDSRNGTLLDRKKVNSDQDLAFDSTISIGESTLRILDANAHVAPARKRDRLNALVQKLNSVSGFLIASVFLGVAMFVTVMLTADDGSSKQFTAAGLAGTVMFIFLWCLVSSLIGKMFRNSMQIRLHWVYICILTALCCIGVLFAEILRFNLNSELVDVITGYGLFIAFLWLALYGLFSLGTEMSGVKQVATATIFTLIPMSFILVFSYFKEEKEQWSNYALMDSRVESPLFAISSKVELDTYLTEVDSLFGKLDKDVIASAKHSDESTSPTHTIALSEKN